MKRITRNEAAKLLCVTPQTITNWVTSGVLGGIKDKNLLLINEDDVLKYKEQLQIMSINEENLQNKIGELKTKGSEADSYLRHLVEDLFFLKKTRRATKHYFAKLVAEVNKDSKKNSSIVEDFFNGMSVDDIAEINHCSAERIRQIVIASLNKFLLQTEKFHKSIDENEKLKAENEKLKAQLIILKGKNNVDDKAILYGKPLAEYDLSNRTKKILSNNGIFTIADLASKNKNYIESLRNAGRKVFFELDDFLYSLGLKWSMDEAIQYNLGK